MFSCMRKLREGTVNAGKGVGTTTQPFLSCDFETSLKLIYLRVEEFKLSRLLILVSDLST